MHDNAAHPWTVPELADISSLSRAAFARVLREALAARVRTEVNASICAGICEQLSEAHRERLLALLSGKDTSGTTKYNRLKQSAKAPMWSHFRAQAEHLRWVDGLGETGALQGWLGEVEGLRVSLAGAEDKLAQMGRRASGGTAIDLGMPRIAAAQPTQAEGTASLTQSLDDQQ